MAKSAVKNHETDTEEAPVEFDSVEVSTGDDEAVDAETTETTETDAESDFLSFGDIEIEGLDIEYESPPVHGTRNRGPAQPKIDWPAKLAALKEAPNSYVRLFNFPETEHGENARAMAQGQVADIRSQLRTAFPNDLWDVKKDTVKVDTKLQWRVYVAYLRDLNAEERAERIKKVNAAKNRAIHAAATRAANVAARKEAEVAAAAEAEVASVEGE